MRFVCRRALRYHGVMPELPEVESVIRGLRDDLSGRRFCGLACSWERTLSGWSAADLNQALQGRSIQALTRRGKYIIIHTDSAALVIHLRMTGRLYICQQDERQVADRWLRVAFHLDDGRELRFSDLRKFGRVDWVDDLSTYFAHLGPEPLSPAFSEDYWNEHCARRKKSIKALLLDQEIIAGIGNIYADEACFLAGVHPARRADQLDGGERFRLRRAIIDVLGYAIQYEGASFQWYRKPDGSGGSLQTHFYVFNRGGQPCRSCATLIKKIKHGGRGTHFCPFCQPEAA